MNFEIEPLLETATTYAIKYGTQLLLALIVLFIGLKIINTITKLTLKSLSKKSGDKTLHKFLGDLISWGLKVLLFVSVASMVGIETTSFVAILGAAGLAIGLALQGTLANFAGGVLCLIFKPYKIGDLVETQGEIGNVKEIQIFTTVILTPQNKTVIIPNGAIMNGNITNHTTDGKKRVDLEVGVSYDADLKRAKETLLKVMQNHPKVLQDPAPHIGVCALADSSVNLKLLPWAKPEDYWDVYFEIQEHAKLALDEAKISIPFPQRDVHIFNS